MFMSSEVQIALVVYSTYFLNMDRSLYVAAMILQGHSNNCDSSYLNCTVYGSLRKVLNVVNFYIKHTCRKICCYNV